MGAKPAQHKLNQWVLLAALAPLSTQARSLGAAEAAIISGASASQVLGKWCKDQGLPPLIARRAPDATKAPDRSVLSALHVRQSADLRYRRVSLACGRTVLSRADNWYAPERLSAGMNRRLDSTDEPFGEVVSELGFHRTTLSVTRRRDLEIRAVLAKSDGAPFSYVIETYAASAPSR